MTNKQLQAYQLFIRSQQPPPKMGFVMRKNSATNLFNLSPEGPGREASLWLWIKAGADRIQASKHIHRIEDITKSGTPDVEGIIDGGKAFWLELKIGQLQVRRPVVQVHTTQHQVYFALKRTSVGGNSWYLIRVGRRPNLWHFLISGQHAEQLLKGPVELDWLKGHSACDPNETAQNILLIASGIKVT